MVVTVLKVEDELDAHIEDIYVETWSTDGHCRMLRMRSDHECGRIPDIVIYLTYCPKEDSRTGTTPFWYP
jgi:hypothetical protein